MSENKSIKIGCDNCRDLDNLGFDISMAFQPIIDIQAKKIVSYEALVRGINGESAYSILSKVNNDNLYIFDQCCRIKAIEKAVALGIDTNLNINFMPNAVYKPETCIRKTLEASRDYGFPLHKINFEVIESEAIKDFNHLIDIITYYRKVGFTTVLDDFGSDHANLDMLSKIDIVKLDMVLIRDIDKNDKLKTIVSSTVNMLHSLGIEVIAEGVETKLEYELLKSYGVKLFQGYYFAKPGFEALPTIDWSII